MEVVPYTKKNKEEEKVEYLEDNNMDNWNENWDIPNDEVNQVAWVQTPATASSCFTFPAQGTLVPTTPEYNYANPTYPGGNVYNSFF